VASLLSNRFVILLAALALYSCSKESSSSETYKAPVPQPPNACVVTDVAKIIYRPCTDTDVPEGFTCWFEACKLPSDSYDCEFGFKPGIVSTPPERIECLLSYPETER
jgi:hypothetical protein